MKAVIQRVREASVTVEGSITGSINRGLLVYLGVAGEDTEKDACKMAEKIANLRIFNDDAGKMNLSLLDIIEKPGASEEGLGILAISQFTLLANVSRGRRPFYGDAADPERANALYEHFIEKIREQGLVCESGVFKAMMDVSYTNEGPVTILLDSREI
ncbi:MAG: D-aminoacyl-tRNA deacylase [Treponema sp.]|nr:D-aminoacyl-tRNA deacylase [Treponema sp.]